MSPQNYSCLAYFWEGKGGNFEKLNFFERSRVKYYFKYFFRQNRMTPFATHSDHLFECYFRFFE